jgi:hypothetical protein
MMLRHIVEATIMEATIMILVNIRGILLREVTDTTFQTWKRLLTMAAQPQLDSRILLCVLVVGHVTTVTLQRLLATKKLVPTRKLALAIIMNVTVAPHTNQEDRWHNMKGLISISNMAWGLFIKPVKKWEGAHLFGDPVVVDHRCHLLDHPLMIHTITITISSHITMATLLTMALNITISILHHTMDITVVTTDTTHELRGHVVMFTMIHLQNECYWPCQQTPTVFRIVSAMFARKWWKSLRQQIKMLLLVTLRVLKSWWRGK